jgi:hypothetical protein
MKYFNFESVPNRENKFMISPNYEALHLKGTTGSYNILPARLMELSYAQYLIMCRELFGAELIGKGTLYVYPLFERNDLTYQFLKLLNSRADYIIKVIRKESLKTKSND